jgi:hypothetical protein
MIYVYTVLIAAVFIVIARIVPDSNRNALVWRGMWLDEIDARTLIVNSLFFLSFLVMFGLSAFRYKVGTDYINYAEKIVDQVTSGQYTKEILFKQLVELSLNLGDTQWIFIFSSAVIVGFTYLAIREQAKDAVYGVLLFMFSTFYSFSLNAIRQAMATAIFLYAIKYIRRGKIVRYFFWIIVAIGFHQIAIIYLPLYFLRYFRVTRTKTINVWLGLFLVLFVGRNVIASALGVIVAHVVPRYAYFFQGGFSSELLNLKIAFLVINVLVMFLVLYQSMQDELDDGDNIYIWLQIIVTLFSAVAFVIPSAFRLFYFFTPVQIILLPNLISKMKVDRQRQLVWGLSMLMFVAFFGFFTIYANYNETLPYQLNIEFLRRIL